jgi:hypothetical protein
MWETLNRTHYSDEDLAWGGTNTKNEQKDKFFTPQRVQEEVNLNLNLRELITTLRYK